MASMSWLWVLLAAALETTWPFILKGTAKNSNWNWLPVALVSIPIMYCLNEAMKSVPASAAYACFVCAGVIGTALCGALFFDEVLSLARILALSLMIFGMVMLYLSPSS
jgi:quaternary ammonium compound-resistance protein SugE